jgi:hypothetical protein
MPVIPGMPLDLAILGIRRSATTHCFSAAVFAQEHAAISR